MSGKGYIADEPDSTCELCGIVAETRPYGPKGERVCFDCGMKDEAVAKRQFAKRVLGEEGRLSPTREEQKRSDGAHWSQQTSGL